MLDRDVSNVMLKIEKKLAVLALDVSSRTDSKAHL